jgi:hypothetical protein
MSKPFCEDTASPVMITSVPLPTTESLFAWFSEFLSVWQAVNRVAQKRRNNKLNRCILFVLLKVRIFFH